MLFVYFCFFFFFKQKTAYEMRISDWSSDVCSSDLAEVQLARGGDARILTDLNRSLREVKSLGEVRKITVASSHDGKAIEGWLTLPPGHVEGPRVPLILEIHGGPFAAYGPHFPTDHQLYARPEARRLGKTSVGQG